MEVEQIREKLKRSVERDDQDDVPICFLIGHIPDEETFAAWMKVVRAGDVQMVAPGFYRINLYRRAETD